MKTVKNVIAGLALVTGLIGLAGPASAAWNHDRDFSRDRRELGTARRELHRDLHRGAGHHEIARDRAAIARERREIWADRRDWRYDRGRHDYRPWYRW